MGRFVSEDPSGFDAGDANFYRCVGNDPIGNTDPTGLQLRTPIQALNSVGTLGAAGIGAGYLGLGLNAATGAVASRQVLSSPIDLTPYSTYVGNSYPDYSHTSIWDLGRGTSLPNLGLPSQPSQPSRAASQPGLLSGIGTGIYNAGAWVGHTAAAVYTNSRVQGTLQALGGASQVALAAGGEALSEGLGTPIALGIAYNGVDNFTTGLKRLWTGQPQETATHQILNKVGGQTFADFTETAINTTAILTGVSRLPKSPFPNPASYSGEFPKELAEGVQVNRVSGNAARDAIAAREAPALTEQTFKTVGGVRRVDVLKLGGPTIAIESKVGRTSLGLRGSRVRQELARDWWLQRQGQVGGVRWEFTPSDIMAKVDLQDRS